MCCFDVSRFARMCEKPNGFLMCLLLAGLLVCWFAGFLGGVTGAMLYVLHVHWVLDLLSCSS